jgi:hypothetical protein
MVLLALALIAQDYGTFETSHATEVCRVDVKEAFKESYASVEECVADHRADYRHFALLTANSDKALAPAFRHCVEDWTRDGMIRWNMVAFCAVDVINGKRDFDMFRAAARDRRTRAQIDACRSRETDEETGLIDWESAGDCARKVVPADR